MATLSLVQLNIGWPWRWLLPFCLKTSSPAPSVWRCSTTQCQHHAATASARPVSPLTGMEEEEEEGAPCSTSVPSARSPSASDQSSISTEPWRKSLNSSRRWPMLEFQWMEELEEWRTPTHILTIIIRGLGRCQRASLLRWWLVFSDCTRELGCLTPPSPIPMTLTPKAPVQSMLTCPSRLRTMSTMTRLHTAYLPPGTKLLSLDCSKMGLNVGNCFLLLVKFYPKS